MLLKGLGILGIWLLLALLPVITQASETLYVQSVKAKLLSSPSFQADTIEVISKGAAIEVVESQQRWIKVNYQDKSGWINKLLVASKPPLNKVTLLEDQPVSQDARRRASSVATSAAARGLSAEDRARLNIKNEFDYAALSQMESLMIEESEVWEFLNEGIGK